MAFRIRDNKFFAPIRASFLCRFYFLERVPAILGKKIFRVDHFDPMAFREFLSAGPNHLYMLRLFHDGTSKDIWIEDMLDHSNYTRVQRCSVHDRGLDFGFDSA